MGNDTETLTLTDFLLARIAEDEAVARDALEQSGPGRWNANDYFDESGISVWSSEGGGTITSETGDEAPMWHIVRFDPTRVLAECEAKRRIVEFARPDPTMPVDSGRFVAAGVLTLLALPYADHPDFREEWRP